MSRPAVSYYSATVERNPGRFPALNGAAEAEVCVVGGGFAGLNAALGLLERGVRDVLVLEAQEVGHGASGRNGGQVGSGQRLDQNDLERMAGERLKPDGFTEVSGVCAHPDARGRGYAGALMRAVIARILARGETAFLHSYADNAGAIALYHSLGFTIRAQMQMRMLTQGDLVKGDLAEPAEGA